MVTGFWRKCITFTGTALALGVVSWIGVSVTPLLTPGIFNALWKASDKLLAIVEKADFNDKISQRCVFLQSRLDELEEFMSRVSPKYGSRIQSLSKKMTHFQNKEISKIEDAEKIEFLEDCFKLASEINNDPLAAHIKSHLVEIAREFCGIQKYIRENPHDGWNELIRDFAKSVAGLLSGLDIIELQNENSEAIVLQSSSHLLPMCEMTCEVSSQIKTANQEQPHSGKTLNTGEGPSEPTTDYPFDVAQAFQNNYNY